MIIPRSVCGSLEKVSGIPCSSTVVTEIWKAESREVLLVMLCKLNNTFPLQIQTNALKRIYIIVLVWTSRLCAWNELHSISPFIGGEPGLSEATGEIPCSGAIS